MGPDGPITMILSQGVMGLVAGLFIWLYLQERKKSTEQQSAYNTELREMREKHFERLDQVRQAQIAREQEVARTLDEYGRSVVVAVDQTATIAQELRRLHGTR